MIVPIPTFPPFFLLHRSPFEVRVQLLHLGLIISHLRLLLRTFSGMYSYFWMWRVSINVTKWTFLANNFCVFCAFSTTSFHSFSIVVFAFEINIALGERSSVCVSRFPDACVSERQISRIFRTIRNFRLPEVRWSEQHSEFVLLSSQVNTWQYLVLPGL